MSIIATTDANGSSLTIKVDGRFDFSSHQEFRQAYETASGAVNSYKIDMSQASYLDSSALGMLLLLRDFAGGDTSKISIVGCNADVKKILTISNFGQLFEIS